jgi:hypothetical protein
MSITASEITARETMDGGEHHATRVDRKLGAQVGAALGLRGRLA